jgi:hypothetical protein
VNTSAPSNVSVMSQPAGGIVYVGGGNTLYAVGA